MGNYVKNFTETFDFDGDTITVTLKQLSRTDAMELMPAMAAMKGMDAKNMTKEDIENSNSFVEVAANILKEGKYIKSISGFIREGNPVHADSENMEDVYKDFYFTSFITSIAMLLIKHGSMTKGLEKKLGKLSNVTEEVGHHPPPSLLEESL